MSVVILFNSMKILVIGSGGREHSLGIKLQDSRHKPTLFFAPGNAGTASLGTNLNISDSDIAGLLDYATDNAIDLAVVGPEKPLVLGIVDVFQEKGIPIIGPDKVAAQLEGSKAWAKAFMTRHHIPTAAYEHFSDYESAVNYLQDKQTYPIVIKADGLAAGKGVTIAENLDHALSALKDCFIDQRFADAGKSVVIEDFLKGEEASIFAFVDGDTIRPMTPAQDHKAIFDGDKGPNTGGMGAYSPAPLVTPEIETRVFETIFEPVLAGFKSENICYKGILYAGLMIHEGIPSIVEFNVRFGDPETQVVLPRLENDLVDIFLAIINQDLKNITLSWTTNFSVCVVLASGGYPGSYDKDIPIHGAESETQNGSHVVHAGTARNKEGQLVTNGGRVLGVVSCHASLPEAISKTYQAASEINFQNMYHRTDIGSKALISR